MNADPSISPARWHQLKELFFGALEQEASHRAAWLREVCADDPSLRDEVERLIRSHEEAATFIETPALARASVPLAERHVSPVEGDRLGPYRIIREIGHGGMGAVYLAIRADDQYQKQVAIKLIRPGMNSGEILRRFRNERQILASLDHPNIARLLDGGTTEDGRPYIVMEYVEGTPITDYCDRHRLTTGERLRLFRTVCAAVQHAHQNLVVHRDLKPSNILVAPDGEPKLLDFGIAKVLNPELSVLSPGRTRTEWRMLTPDYASPEQIRGEKLTTTSDIYSLGIVLYELLTGHRPYRASGAPHELARVICEQEPTKPSTVVNRVEIVTDVDAGSKITITPESVSRARDTLPDKLRRGLSGDLDNIIMMALRKEPQRRYESAAQFSADIRRHLDGLPVIARKSTFGYRAAKFVRRNRLGVAAVALIVMTMLGGLAATLWQARRAEAQRIKAEKRFNDVRKLANTFLFEIYPKIENLQGATEARETLVKRALEYLDSLSQEAGDDRELQRELAAAYEKVGDVQGNPNQPNLGDIEGALASYQKAQVLRFSLVQNNPPTAGLRQELATNYEQEGYILWWSNRTDKALADYDKALALRRGLIAENPRLAEYRRDLASLQMLYGDIPAWNNEAEEALAHYHEARAILETLILENPADIRLKAALARCLIRIGTSQKDTGDFDGALTMLERARVIFDPLAAQDPNSYYFERGLWEVRFAQCEIFLVRPDTEQALRTCPQLIVLAENLVKKDPRDKGMRHDLVSSHSYTGDALLQSGRLNEAVSEFQKALALNAELTAQLPANSEYKRAAATLHLGLGKAQLQLGQIDAALDSQKKARTLLEEIVDEDRQNSVPRFDLATVFQQLGAIEFRRRNFAEAKNQFAHALEILRQLDNEKALSQSDRKIIGELEKGIQQCDDTRRGAQP